MSQLFISVIDNAYFDVKCEYDDGGIEGKIRLELCKKFCDRLKERLGYTMQNNVVSIIDGYDENEHIREFGNPETFFYDKDNDDQLLMNHALACIFLKKNIKNY